MANWQRTLSIADVWDSKDVVLISTTLANRLEALEPFGDYPYIEDMRLELVEELRQLADDDEPSVSEFDYIFDKVYDWGDISLDDNWNGKKVCWIATF